MMNLRGTMVALDVLQKRLPRLLATTGAGLVIVDPHYKISSVSGVEENSNDEQAKFLYAIETLCAQHSAAVMIAHHFAKGDASMKKAIDRAAGGGALTRWPDVVITMTEHDEPECMTAEFSLRNFAPVPPFVVRWEFPLWVCEDELNPALLKKAAGRKDEHPAEDALKALGDDQLTKKEWIERLAWSPSTFSRKAYELVKSNKVKFVSGVYSKAA